MDPRLRWDDRKKRDDNEKNWKEKAMDKVKKWLTMKSTVTALGLLIAGVLALWDGDLNKTATADQVSGILTTVLMLFGLSNVGEGAAK